MPVFGIQISMPLVSAFNSAGNNVQLIMVVARRFSYWNDPVQLHMTVHQWFDSNRRNGHSGLLIGLRPIELVRLYQNLPIFFDATWW